jgi:hypothetical protein
VQRAKIKLTYSKRIKQKLSGKVVEPFAQAALEDQSQEHKAQIAVIGGFTGRGVKRGFKNHRGESVPSLALRRFG